MRPRIGYVGFDMATYYAQEWGQFQRAISGLESLADELDFELVVVSDGVKTAEDGEAARRRLDDAGVDFVLAQAAACGDGQALLPLTGTDARLGLWATPEPTLDGAIQINSLVTVTMFASIVDRFVGDRTTKWFYGHADDAGFRRRLAVTVGALRGIRTLTGARVGWVGGLSPGFYDMHFSESVLRRRLGVTVGSHDLRQLVERARAVEADRAADLVADLRKAARAVEVDDEAMDRGARLYLALRALAHEHGYDAMSVQDWPAIQEYYDMSPLMALSWLTEVDRIPTSHEGDALSAISMLLLQGITGGRPTHMDVAAIDDDAVLLWHCGSTPPSIADADGVAWVHHPTLGRKQDGGPYGTVGDLVLATGPVTIAYLGDGGRRMLALGAEIVERDAPGFVGDRGWATGFHLDGDRLGVPDLLETLLSTGQEHHVALVHGDVTDELQEVAAWLDLDAVPRIAYRDHLQPRSITSNTRHEE